MLDEMRELRPPARLLVINQAGVNLGFYMVLPFLASYLIDDLGMMAATVGLILGARTLSQQGLFLPSGILVDRIGPRPLILIGCALRVVAFTMLGLAGEPGVVLAAVLLVGVAGALFNPAARTYLALSAPTRRAEAFAVFEVWGNVGALLGPVVGAALLLVDFQLACLAAAGVFAVLTVAQLMMLPGIDRDGTPERVGVGIRRVLGDRRLGLLVLGMSGYLAMFNQLYLSLPIEASRVTGRPETIAALFLVFSCLGIVLQVRVTAWCQRRWSAGTAIAVGLALMGASFVPLIVTTALLPTQHQALDVPNTLLRSVPLLLTVAVFTVGGLVAAPYVIVLLSSFVGDRLIGTAYGWYYLVSAIATVVVAWAVGALLDVAGSVGRVMAFALLLAVGTVAAIGVRKISAAIGRVPG